VDIHRPSDGNLGSYSIGACSQQRLLHVLVAGDIKQSGKTTKTRQHFGALRSSHRCPHQFDGFLTRLHIDAGVRVTRPCHSDSIQGITRAAASGVLDSSRNALEHGLPDSILLREFYGVHTVKTRAAQIFLFLVGRIYEGIERDER
jgi:hypothetical protein